MDDMVTNRDLYKEMSKLSKKQRHQVKSRWYYVFWGTATVAVVLGQIYVGTGYRVFATRLHAIFDYIEFKVEEDDYRYYPPL